MKSLKLTQELKGTHRNSGELKETLGYSLLKGTQRDSRELEGTQENSRELMGTHRNSRKFLIGLKNKK